MVAGFRVVPGLARALVSYGDEHAGVGLGFKVVDPGGQFVEFGHREVEMVAAAEHFIAVVVGLPAIFVVCQYGEAGDGRGVAVIQPVV